MADDDHCPICDEALQNLEDIDDDADAVGVRMVKTDDTAFSEFIGLSQFPSIVYYEHSNPHIYDGTQNLKKLQAKKLVKSNKSISEIIYFDQILFFAISKMAKNQFLNWEKV